jgi:transcriptional regulator with XRE-family HTH domain
MKIPVNYFGSNLRSLREQSGLNPRQVAAGAGISATFYADIEHGRRMPSREMVEKLAKVLAFPSSALFKFDPRECINEIAAAIWARPQNGPAVAKLCKGLSSGRIKQRDLERLSCSRT